MSEISDLDAKEETVWEAYEKTVERARRNYKSRIAEAQKQYERDCGSARRLAQIIVKQLRDARDKNTRKSKA